MIFISNNGKSFTKEEAIDLMVSLNATDANSEKKKRMQKFISRKGISSLIEVIIMKRLLITTKH